MHGNLVASALGPVEEEVSLSPGAVILLLQPMVENIARGLLIVPNLAATATDVS